MFSILKFECLIIFWAREMSFLWIQKILVSKKNPSKKCHNHKKTQNNIFFFFKKVFSKTICQKKFYVEKIIKKISSKTIFGKKNCCTKNLGQKTFGQKNSSSKMNFCWKIFGQIYFVSCDKIFGRKINWSKKNWTKFIGPREKLG